MTSCSLILVALLLIGLRLGDSPLVILSLCSVVIFSVINMLFVVSVCFLASVISLSLFFVCFLLCILCSALCFHEVPFNIYLSYLTKKKKNFFHFSQSVAIYFLFFIFFYKSISNMYIMVNHSPLPIYCMLRNRGHCNIIN